MVGFALDTIPVIGWLWMASHAVHCASMRSPRVRQSVWVRIRGEALDLGGGGRGGRCAVPTGICGIYANAEARAKAEARVHARGSLIASSAFLDGTSNLGTKCC